MYYWGKPQFYGVRAAAANIGSGAPGNYTAEQFQEDFPQFFNAEGQPLLPAAMLAEIIRMANTAVQPDRWGESWRYAVGLYVAHYVTLYLRGYAASNETPEQAAALRHRRHHGGHRGLGRPEQHHLRADVRQPGQAHWYGRDAGDLR